MRITIALLLVFSLAGIDGIAQSKLSTRNKKAIKFYQQARVDYNEYKFEECLNSLNQALEKDSKFIEAYFLKADVYNNLGEYEKEAACFQKTIEIDPDYFAYQQYNLAEAYWKSGKYNKAKLNFTAFLNSNKGKPHIIKKAEYYVERCEYALTLVNNPVNFNPINVGTAINNAKNQYWPSLSLDGKTMVYTELQVDSTRKTAFGTYAHQEDFYISHFKKNEWSKGQAMGPPINTPGNEGAQQLSADGNTLVFTGCNRKGGFGRCDIYFAFKKNNTWSKPINAGPNINTKFSEKQPSLSPDGRSLYFSSNRPESTGGMDLYVVNKKNDGSWGKPKNLGQTINTLGDELSPYIHSDNHTLYFSSTGHWGLGQNDLFMTTKLDSNEWATPKNLGYPINSNMDEIGLVVDKLGAKAYYSSNKTKYSRDIYVFDLPQEIRPKPVSYVSGKVFHEETHAPIPGNLELLNPETADTIMWVTADSVTGEYLLCLPSGFDYVLNANHPGYLFWSEQFSLTKADNVLEPFTLDIPLTPIKAGESIVLKNIFFETDSYEILPKSAAEIMKTIEFLNNNPTLKAEISGHTDNQGSSAYNKNLSEQRAKAVYNYISKNINGNDRLSFKGYGETQPISANDTEEGKAKNRRTELKILE